MRTQIEIKKRKWPFVVGAEPLHEFQSLTTSSSRLGDKPITLAQEDLGTSPVGFVHITGKFATTHSNELLRLFREHLKLRQLLHPNERIIEVIHKDKELVIATNSVALVRNFAIKLSSLYWGSFALKYQQSDKFLHMYWWR